MNFQEMYSTSMLFGTQVFQKTKYNVLFIKLLLRYKIVFALCFNASFDHHRFFFSKCDIHVIKDPVAYNVVGLALFGYEKLTLPRGPTNPGLPYVIGIWEKMLYVSVGCLYSKVKV